MPMRRRSARQGAALGLADLGAEHGQPAAGGADREVQQAQQAGLAGAGRAEQPAEAAFGDAEAEAAQHLGAGPVGPGRAVLQTDAFQSHHGGVLPPNHPAPEEPLR